MSNDKALAEGQDEVQRCPTCNAEDGGTSCGIPGCGLVTGGLSLVMPNPTPEDLQDPMFNAIWNVCKSWDVNVPEAYTGYCGFNGSHVKLILDAVKATQREVGSVYRYGENSSGKQWHGWNLMPGTDLPEGTPLFAMRQSENPG